MKTVTMSMEEYKELQDIKNNYSARIHNIARKYHKELRDEKAEFDRKLRLAEEGRVVIHHTIHTYMGAKEDIRIEGAEYAADLINQELAKEINCLTEKLKQYEVNDPNPDPNAAINPDPDIKWYSKLVALFK